MAEKAGIEPILSLFGTELKAVNLGLDSFAENLRGFGVEVVQVSWKPPAGGDEAMIAALDRLSRGCRVDVEAANAEAAKAKEAEDK